MDNENKGFPNGWGDDSEDDDDYGFVDNTDEDDEDSAWGNSSSPFKKSAPVPSPDASDKINDQSKSVTPNINNEAAADSVHGTQIQDIKQPENTSSPAPTFNVPQNQGYTVQKQKTNPVLIIVIIVLVLIIGILGGMFFMMNRKENNKPVESDSKVSEISDNSEEFENFEESIKSDTTTTATAFVAESTELTIASADEVNRAAKKIINDLPKDYMYSLYDVNGDGVSELFVSYMSIAGDNVYILHYYDSSEFKELKEFWGSLSICTDSHYIKEINYGGAEVFIYYELTKDNKLNKLDEIYCTPDGEYYRNGQKISNSEYYAAIYYYDDMNWIDIESPPINVAPTEKETEKNKIPSEYKGFENIENAPSDMEFYNIDNIATGYVSTDSTSLNMRAGAGKDHKVVHEIPKGAEVEIIGANSEWYYVKYFTGGAGAFAVNFYGYVSRQYISSTPVVIETVDVYPCKELGRLNTHGLGVAGFASSYVVDGGEVSEIRHTLGDGWHVTAVNWCYSKDILWYELYDSDDGDYYGWVDENYIDFY